MESDPTPSPASRLSLLPTWIEVSYPADRGAIGLRGNLAPLDWEHTTQPTRAIGDHHLFCVPMREGDLLELEVVRGEEWAMGRSYVVHAGEHLKLEPCFDAVSPKFVRDVPSGRRRSICSFRRATTSSRRSATPCSTSSTDSRSGRTPRIRSERGTWTER